MAKKHPKKKPFKKIPPVKHHIFWQKWEDPITKINNQLNHLNQLKNSHYARFSHDSDEEFTNDIEQDGNDGSESQLSPDFHAIPMISTPMGMMPAPQSELSSFNFWIGHTNFKVSQNIAKILDGTLGVESLDVFSPYRFRIAVGRAFSDKAVKAHISKTLYVYLKSTNA